ncbi:unnamed protein product [Cyclocybe aegerita]|uniref:F-box domain-containing protein n=1 Tax=Cyclocybe aegerita TaxID=1973307 RepID=A0A8S0VQQ6_CYCAE|nr:unnamed protein product [Cyclocybe aegerita]
MAETIQDRGSIPISPRLPPELEREIFEQAGYQDLGNAYQLLFVAKRVYQWVEPMVYRVLFRRSTLTCFHGQVRRRRPYPPLEQFEAGQKPSLRLKQVSSYTTHLLLIDWVHTHRGVAIDILQLHNTSHSGSLISMDGITDT